MNPKHGTGLFAPNEQVAALSWAKSLATDCAAKVKVTVVTAPTLRPGQEEARGYVVDWQQGGGKSSSKR